MYWRESEIRTVGGTLNLGRETAVKYIASIYDA